MRTPLPACQPGDSSTEHVCLCLCNFTCAPTGLKGGALRRHAPRAGAAASGQHDREFVQRVGLQTRHHVVQAGGVGHLGERQAEYESVWHTSFVVFISVKIT